MPVNAEEKEAGREAGRRTQASVDAVVHGQVHPDKIIHPERGEVDAPAGDYELVAREWNKRVSEPGQPVRIRKFRRGDIVTLDEEDAARLLRSGAVKPTTDEQADSPAAKAKTPKDKAAGLGVAASGGTPVPDPDAKPTAQVAHADGTTE